MVNVIGAGLAGSFVTKRLQELSVPFRVFDSQEKFGASKISENLFSKTWLNGHPYLNTSISWLEKNYNIIDKNFQTTTSNQSVMHIPVSEILCNVDYRQRVTKINNEGLFCDDKFFKGINVVCAGYYTQQLINIPDLNALSGHGFLFESSEENKMIKEIMRHHRPFTHEKVMRWHTGEIWYGDSTAIIHNNYIKNRVSYIKQSLERIKKIGLQGRYSLQYGARPFVNNDKKKYGLYKKINKNNFVMTGGWKDGMVLYPFLSNQLVQDLNL